MSASNQPFQFGSVIASSHNDNVNSAVGNQLITTDESGQGSVPENRVTTSNTTLYTTGNHLTNEQPNRVVMNARINTPSVNFQPMSVYYDEPAVYVDQSDDRITAPVKTRVKVPSPSVRIGAPSVRVKPSNKKSPYINTRGPNAKFQSPNLRVHRMNANLNSSSVSVLPANFPTAELYAPNVDLEAYSGGIYPHKANSRSIQVNNSGVMVRPVVNVTAPSIRANHVEGRIDGPRVRTEFSPMGGEAQVNIPSMYTPLKLKVIKYKCSRFANIAVQV